MAYILLVEDDESMLSLYQRTFQLFGHEVATATNGEEALVFLTTTLRKPDAILLDVMMPKMNGLDALRHLKQDPAHKNVQHIPVIMLTNMESLRGPEDLTLALELGATQYIIKSQTDPTEVVKKVEAIIKTAKPIAP